MDRSTEWSRLGAELWLRCPDRFDEILDALRQTVGVYEVIAQLPWKIATDAGKLLEPKT